MGKIGVDRNNNDGLDRYQPAKTGIRVDGFQPMARGASCHSESGGLEEGRWVRVGFRVRTLFGRGVHSSASPSSLNDSLDSLLSDSTHKSSSSSSTMASKFTSSSTGAAPALVPMLLLVGSTLARVFS